MTKSYRKTRLFSVIGQPQGRDRNGKNRIQDRKQKTRLVFLERSLLLLCFEGSIYFLNPMLKSVTHRSIKKQQSQPPTRAPTKR